MWQGQSRKQKKPLTKEARVYIMEKSQSLQQAVLWKLDSHMLTDEFRTYPQHHTQQNTQNDLHIKTRDHKTPKREHRQYIQWLSNVILGQSIAHGKAIGTNQTHKFLHHKGKHKQSGKNLWNGRKYLPTMWLTRPSLPNCTNSSYNSVTKTQPNLKIGLKT